jgi:hypothetical protein
MSDFQFLDKRVQRTKIDFYKALFHLLKQKSFSAITIKELHVIVEGLFMLITRRKKNCCKRSLIIYLRK